MSCISAVNFIPVVHSFQYFTGIHIYKDLIDPKDRKIQQIGFLLQQNKIT